MHENRPDPAGCFSCRKRDKNAREQFRRFFNYVCLFLFALTTEEEIGMRSGCAGPSFSVRPEKEAKGAVLHGTSAAERSRHVKTRSANLPKLDDSHRLKHMGRFVFAPAVRGRGKNPLTSHAVRFCGRCLGLQKAIWGAITFQRKLFCALFSQILSISWGGCCMLLRQPLLFFCLNRISTGRNDVS